MTSYSIIGSIDWLDLLQQNWTNSKHFTIRNQYGDEKFWLLADPDLDPYEVNRLNDLYLLYYRPRQILPNTRYKADIINGGSLKLRSNDMEIVFRPSQKNPNIFYSGNLTFNVADPRQDYFFEPIKDISKGTQVLYDNIIWSVIGWDNREVLLRRTYQDEVITTSADLSDCLRSYKPATRISLIN